MMGYSIFKPYMGVNVKSQEGQKGSFSKGGTKITTIIQGVFPKYPMFSRDPWGQNWNLPKNTEFCRRSGYPNYVWLMKEGPNLRTIDSIAFSKLGYLLLNYSGRSPSCSPTPREILRVRPQGRKKWNSLMALEGMINQYLKFHKNKIIGFSIFYPYLRVDIKFHTWGSI